MSYEQLQAAARKKPDAVWIDEASVRPIALAFQTLAAQPVSLGWVERGMRSGTMKVYGVPIRVHELVIH